MPHDVDEGARQLAADPEFIEWVGDVVAARAAVMSRSKRNGVWVDEGPASARISSQIGEGKTSLIRGLPDPEFDRSEGAGRIERRQATEAQIEAFGGRARTVPRADTAEDDPDPDEEGEEEPPMPEPITDQPDTTTTLRELVAAANVADEAWDAWRLADLAMAQADERWELARRDLRLAWEAAAPLVALTRSSLVDIVELGEAIAAELPGIDEVLAGDTYEPEPQPEASTNIPETIPVAEPECDEALLDRARAHSPVDRLEANRLGRMQQSILAASVRHDGDRKAVAAELGISVGNVETQLEYIGKKGLLPLDLIQRLPGRYAKYASVPA